MQIRSSDRDSYETLPALRYVLITPARNEAAFIEGTIQAVISQTLPPIKWVIVSDGSTDGTDDIVNRYAAEYSWIELVRMPERRERHFAGKVEAFNAGRARVEGMPFNVIVNLDADITFEPDYFAFLMSRFSENSRLGVAGTPFREESKQYDFRFVSTEHVSGCCQCFRRECFEAIGGYRPIKTGGIDLFAVTSARMKGWQTRTFLEKVSIHHREIGKEGKYSGAVGAFRDGQRDFAFGCDPLWHFSRCFYRMFKWKPYLFSGIFCFAGYLWALVTGAERVVPDDFVQFRRTEERRRLAQLGKRLFFWNSPAQNNNGL